MKERTLNSHTSIAPGSPVASLMEPFITQEVFGSNVWLKVCSRSLDRFGEGTEWRAAKTTGVDWNVGLHEARRDESDVGCHLESRHRLTFGVLPKYLA